MVREYAGGHDRIRRDNSKPRDYRNLFPAPPPDSLSCVELTNYVECSGPGGFATEFEVTNAAWYTHSGLARVLGFDPASSTYQVTPGAVSYVSGAGTGSDPAVYNWSYQKLRFPSGSLQTGTVAFAFREFKPTQGG